MYLVFLYHLLEDKTMSSNSPNPSIGGVLDVTTAIRVLSLDKFVHSIILTNDGPGDVYLQLDATTVGTNAFFLSQGETLSYGRSVSMVALMSASTSSVRWIAR
jgi:hypothetical protein